MAGAQQQRPHMVQEASFPHFKGCPERQCCPYLDLPDKPDIGDRPSVPTPFPSLTQTRVSCSLQANTESLRALGGGCWEDTKAAHASAQDIQIKSHNSQTSLLVVPSCRAALGHSCQNVENKCRKILPDSAVHLLRLDSLVMGAQCMSPHH